MFVFKPTESTFSDPASATFIPGIPFGREYSKGDICFLHEELMGSKMFFNSLILREALLASADYLEEALQIKITDTKKEVKKEEPKKETKPIIEETVEEAVVEEPVPETVEEVTEEVVEETKEEVTEEPTIAFEEEFIADVEDVKEEPKKTNKKK